ncbi:MAG: ABC transporter substrate-binding protein [Rhodobacteraceae bacterium]|nr:ABC transporter substrate-binding protein [Paracoccaceae bacterium]
MTKPTMGPALAAAVALVLAGTAGADTIKVGVVAPFSGPFAMYGKQFKDAIDVYVAEHGTKAGDHEVQFIYKDTGGPNPDTAKSVTQELLVKDGVNYLAGYTFTPNALAVAPLVDQAQVPTVIFNAATSIITTKSPYFVRTSFTTPQVAGPLADWAIAQGIKTVVTSVTDYGPGIDAEKGFVKEFEAKGGKIVDSIRMPIATSDFSPFMQRIKAAAPNALFTFIPAGPPAFAFVKSYSDNGLSAAGVQFLGTGDLDEETTLQGLGDAALGIHTSFPYSVAHESAMNTQFKADLAKVDPGAVANFASVGAYDGTEALYRMIAAGGTDGDAGLKAVLGASWESPRGPVSIDPKTHHITENMYIRVVAKDDKGQLINKEIETIKDVPDLGLVSK